jgi:hypothetical protein
MIRLIFLRRRPGVLVEFRRYWREEPARSAASHAQRIGALRYAWCRLDDEINSRMAKSRGGMESRTTVWPNW